MRFPLGSILPASLEVNIDLRAHAQLNTWSQAVKTSNMAAHRKEMYQARHNHINTKVLDNYFH